MTTLTILLFVVFGYLLVRGIVEMIEVHREVKRKERQG